MTAQETPSQAVTPGTVGLDWKTQVYIIGAVVGLLLGLLSAYLYVRAARENSRVDRPKKVSTGDAMKLSLSLLTLIRQIAELGAKN